MKLLFVVGARPNFMKTAPVVNALKKYAGVECKICHTGQHYDAKMSDVFFKQLEISEPEYYLGVGSGSHAVQTAKIMTEIEPVLLEWKPDILVVAGDVNSTIAASLTAVKLGIRIAHIESGLRSFDRSMPEEINRILTDAISDYLFVTEISGVNNLKSDGVDDSKVFFVGNCMIDTLVKFLPVIEKTDSLSQYSLKPQNYFLMTFHRPANVDNPEFLLQLSEFMKEYSGEYKIVFPVHPRTRSNMEKAGVNLNDINNLVLTEPLGYIEFMSLVKDAKVIVTDSGGIQEESTFLKVPCVTVRDNTERPVTVDIGSNYLAGTNFENVKKYVDLILSGKGKNSVIPELWDGKAGERIAEILAKK